MLELTDHRLDRLAPIGDRLQFLAISPGEADPERLRSQVVIAERSTEDGQCTYDVGKFDWFVRQNEEGLSTHVTVTLRPLSTRPSARLQWDVPIEKWPKELRLLAVLDLRARDP
jgi:hypothetical protein